MKIILFLTLLVPILAQAQSMFEEPNLFRMEDINKVVCAIIPSKNIFTCRGPIGVVECGSDSNTTQWLKNQIQMNKPISMNIGSCGQNFTDADSLSSFKLCIFPKNDSIDSSKMENLTKSDDMNKTMMHLFFSDRQDDNSYSGIRITDMKCYSKLVEFLRNSTLVSMRMKEEMEYYMMSQLEESYAELMNYNMFLKKRDSMEIKKNDTQEVKEEKDSNDKVVKIDKRANHGKRSVEKRANHGKRSIEKRANHGKRSVEKRANHGKRSVEKMDHGKRSIEKRANHGKRSIEKRANHGKRSVEKRANHGKREVMSD